MSRIRDILKTGNETSIQQKSHRSQDRWLSLYLTRFDRETQAAGGGGVAGTPGAGAAGVAGTGGVTGGVTAGAGLPGEGASGAAGAAVSAGGMVGFEVTGIGFCIEPI